MAYQTATITAFFLLSISVAAADCRRNPAALDTSRVLAADAARFVGTMQYRQTLPLADHEVVLTFDDGPLPPYTGRVLDLLASQCAKATFFVVGRMAESYPALARREYDEGHTVGTHTENHPLKALPEHALEEDIAQGIESTTRALKNHAPAPFFRFPGLVHPAAVEDDLARQGIIVWSADVVADDWKRISPHQVVMRAISRLDRKGKGILLLHDIHPRTVAALPELFAALKQRGYHLVHVIPPNAGSPALIAAPRAWAGTP